MKVNTLIRLKFSYKLIFLEMTEQCSCLDFILSSTYLPKELTQIVQAYLHSKTRDSLYKSHYENVDFHIRLNKKLDRIEELRPSHPKLLVNGSLLEEMVAKVDSKNNISHWFYLDFIVNNTKYSFNMCLTSNIICARNIKIPLANHNYRRFHLKLVKYFGKNNKDVLLAKIVRQCQVAPIAEDFNRIWLFLHSKIVALVSTIDFYKEIHR